MPLPRPMATPLRTDAAGAPSFGADAPPNFRFRLSFFCSRTRNVSAPPRVLLQGGALRLHTDSERPLDRSAHWG